MIAALTQSEIDVLQAHPKGRKALRRLARAMSPLDRFVPRPDCPEDHDEQTGFVRSDAKFSCCLGGTGSGKTIAAAVKTAEYVLKTKPPRPECPFWVVGESYELTCGVCWREKLAQLLPKNRYEILSWVNKRRGWPSAVGITRSASDRRFGWILEFKSYEQGLGQFKSASIGGFWCNEEVDLETIEEIQGRCRDYDSPGWADFTPIEIVSPDWPKVYDACESADKGSQFYRDGWEFFHLNTLKNDALAEGWGTRFLANVPEEMRATRQIGVFASFMGKVFKNWRYKLNVIEECQRRGELPDPIPQTRWKRIRGIDFGYNDPFVCLWVGKDSDGRYYVFDEHFAPERTTFEHAAEINSRPWSYTQPTIYGATYADRSGAQDIHDLSQLGVKCQGAITKTPGQRAVLLNDLMRTRGDGKPRLFVSAKCANLIREIDTLRWAQGTEKRNAGENPLDKDNHAIDAMGYAICSDIWSQGMGAPKPAKREWTPRFGVKFGKR